MSSHGFTPLNRPSLCANTYTSAIYELHHALDAAIERDHEETVSLLLDRGAAMESKNSYGRTPLMTAAEKGHKNIVLLLLDRGAAVDSTDSGGNTPLLRATLKGHMEIVSLLLDREAAVDTGRDYYYGTPLMIAIREGHTKIASLLLDRGAAVDGTDYGDTPLLRATREGHTEIVSLLLDRGATMDSTEGWIEDPLILIAVKRGHKEIVSLLLDRGAGVNSKGYGGATPLLIAAQEGYTEIVSLLLDRGATVDSKNYDGDNPLMIAVKRGHKEIVPLLLDRGAVVDSKSYDSDTPLLIAVREGHTKIVSLLLSRVTTRNSLPGDTLLMIAAHKGYNEIVSLLLDRGAGLDTRNGLSGDTPLIRAVQGGYIQVVSLLLARGAMVDARNHHSGYTALMEAAKAGHKDVMSLLLDHGANVNTTNDSYQTAFVIAAQHEENTLALLLLESGAKIYSTSIRHYSAVIETSLKAIAKLDNTYACSRALMAAAASGLGPVVAALLKERIDVNIIVPGRNAYGTPLIAAAANGFQHVVSVLLNHGASIDLNTPARHGTGECCIDGQCYGNALIAAAANARGDVVCLLANRGANVNAIASGHRNRTALVAVTRERMTASRMTDERCRRGYRQVMRLLLDRGAEINFVFEDHEYGTALNIAVFLATQLHDHTDRSYGMKTLSLLLDRGADANIAIGNHGTALGIAAYEGDEAVVAMLLAHGADAHHVGGRYQTLEGMYPTALDAAEAGAKDRGPKNTRAMDSLRNQLSRVTYTGSVKSDSGLGTYSTRPSPPFPMPYTHAHQASVITPDLRAGGIHSVSGFSTASDLTPEQASWACKTLGMEMLTTILMALVGINEPAAERHHTLINNDVRYFINKGYDLGLAYAACRVAWRNFNDKTFNVVAHRGRWHKEANAIDTARANIIYQDANTGQELIRSPYHVMPRRLWDLKSNRVVEFRMLLSDVLARQCHNSQADGKTDLLPSFWAITHSWTSTMAPFETPINQYQWPVPLPRELHNDGGARLRQELLMFGAEYVWLDVLCLRQHSNLPKDKCSPHMRSEEWKLDVPTIGNIYRKATTIVRYFNGLGLPFKNEGWGDPQHWLRRAWTLQEIRSENVTVNAGRPNDGTVASSLMNATGLVAEHPVKLRNAIRPVVQLAAEVDSPAGCSVYDLAREMAKRFATKATDKVAGLLYLLRTIQLPTYNEKLSDEEAWTQCFHLLPFDRKIEILGDFPYRGSKDQWFPTWKQLLEWPLRDPQYLHARSVWQSDDSQQSHKCGTFEGQYPLFVPDIWIIPDALLLQLSGLNEYYIEIDGRVYDFYCPYYDQEPIQVKPQASSRYTLATISLKHSNNWIVCQIEETQTDTFRLESREIPAIAIKCLRKIGVLATDSCSELFVRAGTSHSVLKNVSCLFI